VITESFSLVLKRVQVLAGDNERALNKRMRRSVEAAGDTLLTRRALIWDMHEKGLRGTFTRCKVYKGCVRTYFQHYP
jgi:hypothetical protein